LQNCKFPPRRFDSIIDRMKRFLLAALGGLAAALAGFAQEAGPVLTQQQCIAAALAEGPLRLNLVSADFDTLRA
jgi:hypothetical protein